MSFIRPQRKILFLVPLITGGSSYYLFQNSRCVTYSQDRNTVTPQSHHLEKNDRIENSPPKDYLKSVNGKNIVTPHSYHLDENNKVNSLEYAVQNYDSKLFRLLLSKFDPEQFNKEDKFELKTKIIQNPNIETFKIFVDYFKLKEDKHFYSRSELLPNWNDLFIICGEGDLEVIKYLVEEFGYTRDMFYRKPLKSDPPCNGWDFRSKNELPESPAHAAWLNNHKEIVAYLGSKFRTKDKRALLNVNGFGDENDSDGPETRIIRKLITSGNSKELEQICLKDPYIIYKSTKIDEYLYTGLQNGKIDRKFIETLFDNDHIGLTYFGLTSNRNHFKDDEKLSLKFLILSNQFDTFKYIIRKLEENDRNNDIVFNQARKKKIIKDLILFAFSHEKDEIAIWLYYYFKHQ